ncbi:glycine zipper 2TM domain-containing protein [Phenylobacterium sp.]|uniref:glycine zipper 2TM domain-containing protein n=1 Tax=Phenylobacterium sp. TaxID=1871053 RepID=UPI0035B2D061
MNRTVVLAVAAAIAAPAFVAPQFAAAQSARNYGEGDICKAEQRRSANTGTAVGAVAGALFGSAVASHGRKTEGAVLGGAVGAVAGHEIGKRRVKCLKYPKRVAARADCHWVQEYYGGRNHDFEVCRGRDGVWRPSGRT